MEDISKPMGAAPIGVQPEQGNQPAHSPYPTLNEARRKFCAGIGRGLCATQAYAEAYPGAARPSAQTHSAALLRKDEVKMEIARLRAADSAVLDCAKKRRFLARVVRASLADLETAEPERILVLRPASS